jgi:hypothetical protein
MEGQEIYKRIGLIMQEANASCKNNNNAQQGFKYRGIDDVYNAIQPIMAKHGVFSVLKQRDFMKRDQGTTKSGGIMHFMHAMYDVHFYAPDGSFVVVTLEAEGMDTADKGTNKCHSVVHKYALLTLLMIPTEDLAEPDAHTPEAMIPKPIPQPVVHLATDAQRKAMFARAKEIHGVDGEKELRALVANFGHESTKQVTGAEATLILGDLDRQAKMKVMEQAHGAPEKPQEELF